MFQFYYVIQAESLSAKWSKKVTGRAAKDKVDPDDFKAGLDGMSSEYNSLQGKLKSMTGSSTDNRSVVMLTKPKAKAVPKKGTGIDEMEEGDEKELARAAFKKTSWLKQSATTISKMSTHWNARMTIQTKCKQFKSRIGPSVLAKYNKALGAMDSTQKDFNVFYQANTDNEPFWYQKKVVDTKLQSAKVNLQAYETAKAHIEHCCEM